METEKGYNVLIKGNKCYRCGAEWRPRDINKKTLKCVKCNSPYWKTPRRNNS